MQYCRRGRKCGDLCPAPSQSYVWISLLNVGSLFGRSIYSTAATTPIVILMVFSIKHLHSWRKTAEGHWTGVMKGRVWTLTQTDDTLWYHVYRTQERQRKGNERKRKTIVPVQIENKPKRKFKQEVKEEEEPLAVTLVQDAGEEREMLRDYFQMDVNLDELYNKWGAADPHFRSIANVFTGLCEGLEFYYTPIGNQAVFDRYILSLFLQV